MTLIEDLAEAGSHEWFRGAVDRMVRGDSNSLDGCLITVGKPFGVEETRTVCRSHFVARDGNGNVRVNSLAQKLAFQVVDYCIPRSRIEEANQEWNRTGSTEHFARLESGGLPVAERMDIAVGTASATLSQARSKLRTTLNEGESS